MWTASIVAFEIEPPLPFAWPVLSPVTVKLPVVLVSEMPVAAPFVEMLVNESAPPTLDREAAVPVVVVRVFVPLALIVPPPVAVKAALAPVPSERPPVKVIVAPVLLAREMP